MFDFSRTFRSVNTDFFFNFSDILLISPTSDPSDFLLNRAVRAVYVPYNVLNFFPGPGFPTSYVTISFFCYSLKLNFIFYL